MTKNKYFLLITLLLSALVLNACVRPVSDGSPTQRGTALLEQVLTATIIPVNGDDEQDPSEDELVETAVQQTLEAQLAETEQADSAGDEETTPLPSATLHIITPTATAEPTEEGAEPEETAPAATGQAPAATNTPSAQPTTSANQINPDQEFKGAKHVDALENAAMWYDTTGTLPDSEYLKLELMDGKMIVTGKLDLWDTWWISGFSLDNFYIEMEVNSGDCSGSDTYGMILRASQHGQPTHGYLIGFTCDGKVLAKRLETVNPYVAVSILNPTETEFINAGPNQTNIIGVAFDGNSITIYPNRYYFTTIQDSAFSYGRYGIYVQAGADGNYTYTVEEIRTWGIIE